MRFGEEGRKDHISGLAMEPSFRVSDARQVSRRIREGAEGGAARGGAKQGSRKAELLDEGYANASDEDVKSRIASLKATVDLRYSAAKCIATDDPRLKKDNYDAEGDL